MHFDVMGLVSGGYGAQEIMATFRRVYGERVLMEPVREGFNWLAYILPFGALVGGAGVVLALLKHWTGAASDAAPVLPVTDATPEELERLRDVLRNDE
jgi:cytochrome c-type biogenesis protein CcmH